MKRQPVGICATCPWRVGNHGKFHPAGWYKISNLKRLWNGLRTGKAPGMICHSTDPNSYEYGAIKSPSSSTKPQPCGGALLLIGKEMNALGKAPSFPIYQLGRRYALTLAGARFWANHLLFGGLAGQVIENSEGVDLPPTLKR